MTDYRSQQHLPPILHFLQKIGVPFSLEKLTEETFLPGISICRGTLLIDTEKLAFPGDVLHEAGHIAVAPADVRPHLSNPIDQQLDFDAATHELMTLAWSYAAAIAAGTPIEVVFHPEGYKGQHESILRSFQSGHYVGLPMLQWLGMAYDANNAALHHTQPFPQMLHWLRPASKVVELM